MAPETPPIGPQYHLITCIVERGQADAVVTAALTAGAQAATFFYGRGRGLKEKLGVWGAFIIPEKEIIPASSILPATMRFSVFPGIRERKGT